MNVGAKLACAASVPGEAAPDHDDEQEHSDRPRQNLDRGARDDSREPGGDRTPPLRLQPRLRPQHRQRHERHDQDHRRSPGEQPLGDGEVGAADEPVGEGGRRRERAGAQRRPEPSDEDASPHDGETLSSAMTT